MKQISEWIWVSTLRDYAVESKPIVYTAYYAALNLEYLVTISFDIRVSYITVNFAYVCNIYIKKVIVLCSFIALSVP